MPPRLGLSISGLTSVTWDKAIEPSIQKFTADIAENVLRRAVASGFDPQPVVITDGVPNRDWRQVKPFGKIEWARRPVMKDAALWIMNELVTRSPVGPGRHGHYRDRHIFMINGAQVDAAALDNLKPTDRLQIVNTQIYAKKLEGSQRRKLSLRPQHTKAKDPAGVYQVVQKAAASRFGRTIFIDFKYVQLNLGQTVMRRMSHGRRIPRPHRVNAVYPCIQLYIKTLLS
jgi:hypothetical protein